MPGSASDPVVLDPWQEIVEVGWSGDEANLRIGATLQKSVFISSLQSCSGGTESFNLNDHSGNYLMRARLAPFGVPDGAGFLGDIPVTFSGFDLGNVDRNYGDWEFAQKAFDVNVDRRCVVAAKSVNLSLNNVDGLSGSPVCRNLLIGGGRVSASRTGSAVAPGPSYNFEGGMAVEVGGEGRTFSVSHITLASDTEEFVSVNIYMNG